MASEPRVWAECPDCVDIDTGKPCGWVERSGPQYVATNGAMETDAWTEPCPTCAAHWRGVDEALHASVLDDSDVTAAYERGKAEGVREEREACALVAERTEQPSNQLVHYGRARGRIAANIRARGGDGKGGA